MVIFSSIEELQKQLNSIRKLNKTIGFVPTMGALHAGHLSLIEAARAANDIVICSIFVNPTQFNELSDLEKYPRTPEVDTALLESAGCHILFSPAVSEMYSEEELRKKRDGIEDLSWTMGRNVDFGTLDKVMEGAQRPGHFNGVAQVVSKLFRIVGPDRAYFGQKDFQQLAVVRSMNEQLELGVEIIACPILREPNGLAMSSRNERLSPEQRMRAGRIFSALDGATRLGGTVGQIVSHVKEELRKEPEFQVEYVEVADRDTLLSLPSDRKPVNAVLCVALRFGPVRLIDNMVL